MTGADARYVACSAAEALDMNAVSGGGREVISLFVEAKSHASGTTLIALKVGPLIMRRVGGILLQQRRCEVASYWANIVVQLSSDAERDMTSTRDEG